MICVLRSHVVADTTKVRIFKQITTPPGTCSFSLLLLLIPQRYEFSSKSQQTASSLLETGVVADTTKVRIFKQITTCCGCPTARTTLLLIPQRYEFSSKSQHKVFIMREDTWLLLIPQRYEFSSKSQLGVHSGIRDFRCC